ncbi:MAG: sigma-70 family RNA polymerase sigma factor, partial [Planctomycetales bacterium]|nr:sigma-70 family RNA polymerase sigma factor [Planctomycetales bacterium]
METNEDQYAALVDSIRGGDRNALATLIDQKQLQLLAFIQRSMSDKLRQKVDPGDILQETSVRAIESIESYDVGQRDPFAWLCQLAERRIVDAHRKHFATQKRAGEREQSLDRKVGSDDQQAFVNMLVTSMTTPSAAFARNQREGLLSQAIGELPETAQLAIRLRYVDGLPTKDIAEQI